MITLYVIAYIVVGITMAGLFVRFNLGGTVSDDDFGMVFTIFVLWPAFVVLLLPAYLGLRLFSVISGVKL